MTSTSQRGTLTRSRTPCPAGRGKPPHATSTMPTPGGYPIPSQKPSMPGTSKVPTSSRRISCSPLPPLPMVKRSSTDSLPLPAPPRTAATPATQTLDAEVATSATKGEEPAVLRVTHECLMSVCTGVFGLTLCNFALLEQIARSSLSPDIIIKAAKQNTVGLRHGAEACAYISIVLALGGGMIAYDSFLLHSTYTPTRFYTIHSIPIILSVLLYGAALGLHALHLSYILGVLFWFPFACFLVGAIAIRLYLRMCSIKLRQ